jgi:predicted RNA-binding protein
LILKPVILYTTRDGTSEKSAVGKRSVITNMCEANAYLLKDGKEELILEAVDVLENEGNQVRIANIFGEQKLIRGRIRSMSLVNHKILLEE